MAKKDKKEVKNNKDKTSFMKSFKAELKKVIWPTPKQLFNNTVAVLAIVLVTALIVFVLDLAFESINKYGIDRVKEAINSSVVNEVTDTNVDAENTTSEEIVTEDNNTESNEVIENTNNEE